MACPGARAVADAAVLACPARTWIQGHPKTALGRISPQTLRPAPPCLPLCSVRSRSPSAGVLTLIASKRTSDPAADVAMDASNALDSGPRCCSSPLCPR